MNLADRAKSALAGKRLLVTGAAGFIGGALLQRFADYGLDVTGTVQFEAERDVLRHKGYRAEVLDLSSDLPWDRQLCGIDIVFSVAAKFNEIEASEAESSRSIIMAR